MKRYKGLITGCLATLFFILAGVNNSSPKVVFNFTSSMPLGIYLVQEKQSFSKGDVLVFRPPENVKKIIHDRKWLVKKHGYLLKPLIAGFGDVVCLKDDHFYINNVDFGEVKSQDREGRDLPDYHFCGPVKNDTFFVGVHKADSFDSRYFGPIKSSEIMGTAESFLTF